MRTLCVRAFVRWCVMGACVTCQSRSDGPALLPADPRRRAVNRPRGVIELGRMLGSIPSSERLRSTDGGAGCTSTCTEDAR